MKQKEIHFSKFQILAFYFIIGFFALAVQAVLLRELMVVVLGNEFVFGLILSLWLLGIYFGAILAARVCQRTRRPTTFLILGSGWLALFPLIALSLSRLLYQLSGTPAGTYIPFSQVIILAALIVVPCSFVVGFLFPLGPRLISPAAGDTERSASLVSQAYMSEALGAVCSGLLFSFLLAGRLGSFLCIVLCGLPLLVWLGVMAWSEKVKGRLIILIVCLLYGLLLFPGVGSNLEKGLIKHRWRGVSGNPLLTSFDSRYQNLALGQLEDQISIFTNGQLSATFPEEYDNQILAAHLFCQHPSPRRILVIGEVSSGLAGELLKYDISTLTSVEIDAAAVNLVNRYLPAKFLIPLSDPRFQQIILDGRLFVRQIIKQAGKFDMVFLNLPEPATLLLNRFYTREFFQDIKKILTVEGTLALKITSSENYFQGVVSHYTSSVYHTLKGVLPHIAIAPGTENFFFASTSSTSISMDPGLLENRFRRSGVKPDHLVYIFSTLYPKERTDFIRQALDATPSINVNRDLHPVSNLYFNKILGWYSGVRLEGIFGIISKLTPFRVMVFLLLLVALRLLYMFSLRKKSSASAGFNLLLIVCAVGFLGISLELMIIYTFQILYGYVYQLIGFLIALFMLGLPLGAQLSKYSNNRILCTQKRQIIAITAACLSLGLMGLALPVLFKISMPVLASQFMIYFLAVACGFLVGAVFPLAINIYRQQSLVRAAGMVDGADHLGAGGGALVTGALMVPILGLAATGWILFLLSFFAAIPLVFSIKQK